MAKYETTYDVFKAWEERCLKDSKSLLFDEPDLWTEENLKIVIDSLLDNLDEGDGNFEEKIERQFSNYDKSHKIWLMLCDLSALHYCPYQKHDKKINKLRFIETIMKKIEDNKNLKIAKESIENTKGCAALGPHNYMTLQYLSFGYYSSFALKYKQDEKLQNLIRQLRQNEPCWGEAEKHFDSTNIIENKYLSKMKKKKTAHPQVALNMFCRRYHYRMFSGEHRELCIDAFSQRYLDDTYKSENQKIYIISEGLKKDHPDWEKEESGFVNFYRDPLVSLWRTNTKKPNKKDNKKMLNDITMDYNSPYIKTLKEFRQLILQGPPGTGKTYMAKEIVKNLIGINWKEEQGQRWEIIQFHPSYNYEDFVRGIQIETDEKGNANYKTVNRVLAEMAEKAKAIEDPDNNPYILIIDEINRANVAAVLGELIYALEYRGEPVKTTYSINGNAEIVLPENLYIIGTMNTADRTIGQIDYAVRRRFAFITLSPEREVVEKESKADDAVEVFDMVAELFERNEFLSHDYHPEDVAIGHSYFLAKDNEKLKAKIEYQVIPILEEYVKDGVLLIKAKEKIEELKNFFDPHSDNPNSSGSPDNQKRRWKWKNRETGEEEKDLPLRRLVLSIVKNYVTNKKPGNITELKLAFPDDVGPSYGVVQLHDDPNYMKHTKKGGTLYHDRYFVDDLIDLRDGTKIMVCGEWSGGGEVWEKFKSNAEKLGYEIEEM